MQYGGRYGGRYGGGPRQHQRGVARSLGHISSLLIQYSLTPFTLRPHILVVSILRLRKSLPEEDENKGKNCQKFLPQSPRMQSLHPIPHKLFAYQGNTLSRPQHQSPAQPLIPFYSPSLPFSSAPYKLAIKTPNPTSAATTTSIPIPLLPPAPETCCGVGVAVAFPRETVGLLFVGLGISIVVLG